MSLSSHDTAILKAADKFGEVVIGDPCEGDDGPFAAQLRDLQRLTREGFLTEVGFGWSLTNRGEDALTIYESKPDIESDAGDDIDPEND